ncbi:4497_t:CDS:1 [Dentiscutata erythropus]|uniref:4497_t:CDS:1 n=1 Tax=Dentiscutata erythropus TaxID=1348616 RepID=A0A9N9H237_9GLOM|nr:4497_t:CDS:1 [Dentiscutata erythropus]
MKMTHMINEVINDLLAATPCEVLITPPPYDEKQTLNDKVNITYRHVLRNLKFKNQIGSLVYSFYLGKLIDEASPDQQTEYRKRITKHYYMAVTRAYWLFKTYGMEQAYCTQKLVLSDLATMKAEDF